MCLIAFAIQQDEQYPFIFIANRDEFYERPTQSMHWWEDENIVAGKDLLAGGTWIAFGKNQQFAAVTNYRDLERNQPTAPSRGAIPVNLIKENPTNFQQYVINNKAHWSEMNGFNLLYHNGKETFYYSNISEEVKTLDSGVYAISNAFLDTPWPKVVAVKSRLQHIIENEKISVDNLLEILSNHNIYPEEQLPETGVGIEMEKLLSPICIQSPIYGTRVSTIFLKGNNGTAHVAERDVLKNTILSFDIK
ncbi:MAG TPA: NRDE family protein [Chitinophagales bacterium]|nr:NRDE family protein [Chitinophagales bacterium]